MIFRGRRSYRYHPGGWTRNTASLPLQAEFDGREALPRVRCPTDSRKNGRDALLRVRWLDDILKKEQRIAAIMLEIKALLEQKP